MERVHGIASNILANPDPLSRLNRAVEASPAADVDESPTLRSELARLTRENKTLRIALAELERIVDRDTLTPLYNRRFFMNALYKRQARLTRHGEHSALIFIDVDGLKKINDNYGHGAGDFALIEIALRLTRSVRATDVVARLAGDEFGVILDHVDEAGAFEKTSRLRDAISATPANFNGILLPLSAAMGFIMINATDSEEVLLARADKEMYRVKQQRATSEPATD